MDTTSYWIESAALPRFPKPEEDVKVDVIVVGGGITGITAAYLLKKAGQTVALVERERCAQIDTGHTTAHLTSVTDEFFSDLKERFGADAARAVWDAGGAAIDQIVNNVRAEDIGCDFRWVSGYLHAPFGSTDDQAARELRREADALAELRIKGEFTPRVAGFGLPGVHFPHQALFHPRKYLAALVRTIPGDGSHVFEHAAVEEVEDQPLAVKIGAHRIRGRYLVLATHTPLMGKAGTMSALLFQTKLYLYTSYALGAKLPTGLLPEASWWDTSEPYYYLRVEKQRGHDYAIFGGEDHKTGQIADTTEPYRKLEEKFRSLVPQAQVDHRWSGQVIATNDGLPFIGETAEGQFAATGFAGNGMTFGTLGGMMAVDAALGRKNPWQELFDPHRKKLRGGTWSYVRENADYPYYMLRDRLAKAEAKTLDALACEQGKILNLDGQKVAAYRDADGQVSLCSPVCTHLQCIVAWNDAEQTWDCPCHGSRFKPTGEVISGPAEEPLEKITLNSAKQKGTTMAQNLNGKTVAILATDGFEQSELLEPRQALQDAGAKTVLISPNARIKGWKEKNWGETLNTDVALKEAKAEDYDALLLPGGVMNPDSLRQEEAAVEFVRAFFEAGKPVAAICHGPQMLIEADVVNGRTLTSFPSVKTDLMNAGAKWVDEAVVVDEGLVTSRKPADIPQFKAKMIEEIAEGKHAGQKASR